MLSESNIAVTVACRRLEAAKSFCHGLSNCNPISLDVSNQEALDAEVAKVDLVISLIPYTHHATVIQSAIRHKKHVVTTSYVSPAMQELDAQAKEAGITVMNEIGLDPGIDHLYAVKTIEEVHQAGGKIESFYSYCGGLPAPEASDNPLGYKFSWSSRGVLLALRNPAKLWKDGKIEEIPGPELMGVAKPYFIYPGYNFVAYPNRDSTPYKERYNMPEAQNLVRGTLRYGGFPEFIRVLVDIGFLSDEKSEIFSALSSSPPTWAKATAQVVGAKSDSRDDIIKAISNKTKFKSDEEETRILAGMAWIGMFSDEAITPRDNPLDTLCASLEQKMQFEEGERDLVMLQHKFGIEWADGRKEVRTSTLVEYGEPTTAGSTSAMAKLVGVPCAVATKMVLDGRISDRGILAPITWRLAEPLMEELKKYGIELTEKTVL